MRMYIIHKIKKEKKEKKKEKKQKKREMKRVKWKEWNEKIKTFFQLSISDTVWKIINYFEKHNFFSKKRLLF